MHDSLDNFVEDALRELDAADGMVTEKSGDQISHYTLIEEIGVGGFGVVWRAEQSQPVKRDVALKIIKAGMDTREVISRFKAERQALAVMEHPNIAKVYDAGATPTGRPFFVMELVRGVSLTNYCEENALPLPERLVLFIEICRAVQHAHQKGIIHRDLKPSNLLITLADGQPQPKVIDFGIAKATGVVRLIEHTLVTRTDRLMGTPAYMSPEQSLPGMDLDTRTDLYSLGVVLYELLTGQVPFPLGGDGRVKRECDAQKPSTRIKSFTAEQLRKLGATQQIAGPKLIGLIKGDLDWIAVKALEADRTRRYDSATALADDVLAYLNHQPVAARPPTTWYLLTRFTQRNKLAVSAAASILLVLIAGIAISTWLFYKERQALARSEQVTKFMKAILEEAGPSKALGDDTKLLLKIIASTASRLDTELNDQPEVKAELHGIIGRTYEELDEYELSLKHSTEELRLRREHGSSDEMLATALLDRAYSLESLGRMKEAETDVRAALAIRQRLAGDSNPSTAATHGLLAWILLKSGRPLEGEASAKIAVAAWRANPRFPDLGGSATTLAAVYHNTNRHDQAIAMYQELLQTVRKLYGNEHPDVLLCLDNLGVELCRVKRFEEAEPMLLESLRQGEKMHPKGSPVADHAYAGLSRVAAWREQYDLQLKYARESLTAAKRVYAPGHRYYREASNVLAGVLLEHAERNVEQAWKTNDEPTAKQAIALIDEVLGSQDYDSEQKKSGSWLDCLRGRALMLAPLSRTIGQTQLSRGLIGLRQNKKPTKDDERRLKKAESWSSGTK